MGYPPVLSWLGGFLPWLGDTYVGIPPPPPVLTRLRGTYLSRGGGTYLGVPLSGPGQGGVPTLAGGTYLGVPPLSGPWCGQTKNITFPHPLDAISKVDTDFLNTRNIDSNTKYLCNAPTPPPPKKNPPDRQIIRVALIKQHII